MTIYTVSNFHLRCRPLSWLNILLFSIITLTVPLSLAWGKKAADDTSNPAYASTAVVITANKSGKPAKPAGFVHPGVLVNRKQLDEIKRRVAAGIEPQKSAFEKLKASTWGALDYTPHPRDTVECGSFSNPDLGCKAEQADSQAAYAQALLWYITGNSAYAENAIKIMNAWSSTLTGGHTNANGPVQASWGGDVFPRAAEIIRYTYKRWPDAEIARFQNMLTTQYLSSLIHGTCENGNKELTMSEALINIGVFNDNRAAFELGLKMWRGRTPAYIYLKTDGPKPVDPPGCGPALWGNKGFTPEFVDGLLQESARDSGHANLALAGMVDAAETARQQGVDLYAEQGNRIMAALEFQAQYLPPNNAQPPEGLEFHLHPTWEIAYNEFHDRLGNSLPKMAVVLPLNRPTGVNHPMNWETLTHAGMGGIGLPPVKKQDIAHTNRRPKNKSQTAEGHRRRLINNRNERFERRCGKPHFREISRRSPRSNVGYISLGTVEPALRGCIEHGAPTPLAPQPITMAEICLIQKNFA